MGTVSCWVRNYQDENNTMVPTRMNMHDLGCGVSHKRHIIPLYLQGKLSSEIVRQTGYNMKNVSWYIRGFETIRMLRKKHPPLEVTRLSRLNESLCIEYFDLYDNHHRETRENGSEAV